MPDVSKFVIIIKYLRWSLQHGEQNWWRQEQRTHGGQLGRRHKNGQLGRHKSGQLGQHKSGQLERHRRGQLGRHSCGEQLGRHSCGETLEQRIHDERWEQRNRGVLELHELRGSNEMIREILGHCGRRSRTDQR